MEGNLRPQEPETGGNLDCGLWHYRPRTGEEVSYLLTSPSRVRGSWTPSASSFGALVLTFCVHQNYLEGLLKLLPAEFDSVGDVEADGPGLHWGSQCFTEWVPLAEGNMYFNLSHLFSFTSDSFLSVHCEEKFKLCLTKARVNCSLPAAPSASLLHLCLGAVRSVPTSLTR